jgi:hypothetical protein
MLKGTGLCVFTMLGEEGPQYKIFHGLENVIVTLLVSKFRTSKEPSCLLLCPQKFNT